MVYNLFELRCFVLDMDLSMFRLMLLSDEMTDISADLKKFDGKDCCFYYDETNNARKVWIKENDFNVPVNKDFVLGGVMHFGEFSPDEVSRLKQELHLQKSAPELKFKHIGMGKDFLGCLSEPKVKVFLQWLYSSNLYIHFSNVNNLYWAIVDIVDTVEEPAYTPFVFDLKNSLYKIACANYSDFYQLLVACNYPNVTGQDIRRFYQGIIDFVDNIPSELSFEMELLRQSLKSARRQKELVFLQENEEKTVLESYFNFYIRPLGIFPDAQHIFDNEYQIEDQFKQYTFSCNGAAINHQFVNSVDVPLVQVSDCVVGLMGKYFEFLNGCDIHQAQQLLNTLTSEQYGTLNLLIKLMKKSENLSKLLFCSVESREEHDVGAFILNQTF